MGKETANGERRCRRKSAGSRVPRPSTYSTTTYSSLSSLKGSNCGLCSLALSSPLSPLSPSKRKSLGPFSRGHNNPARIFCPFPIEGSAARCLTGNVPPPPPPFLSRADSYVCSLMGEFPPYFYLFFLYSSSYLFPYSLKMPALPAFHCERRVRVRVRPMARIFGGPRMESAFLAFSGFLRRGGMGIFFRLCSTFVFCFFSPPLLWCLYSGISFGEELPRRLVVGWKGVIR